VPTRWSSTVAVEDRCETAWSAPTVVDHRMLGERGVTVDEPYVTVGERAELTDTP
jgi:hypothetical protein